MALSGADTITLDPSEVSTNRTPLVLTGAIEIRDADYGNAQMEQVMVSRTYGETSASRRLPNRQITYKLRIRADGSTTAAQALRSLQQKVARFQMEGGWLKRDLNPATAGEFGEDILFCDVVDAALTLPADWLAQRQEVFLDAELTLSCLPDFYGSEVQARKLLSTVQRVVSNNASLSTLIATSVVNGSLVDQSSNAYACSLLNGASISTSALGGEDAIVLDGVNDYASIAAPTRRNPITNPSIETNTTGYFASGTNTIAASTDQAFAGSQSLKVTYGNTLLSSGRSISSVLAASTTYWIQARVYIPTDWDGGAISIDDGGELSDKTVLDSTNQSTTTKGSWVWLRYKVTTGADIVANLYFRIASAPTVGKVFYVDAVMIEASTASTCPAYFDGAGYVDANGTYQASAGVRCGWLGTAHASASDYGPLANGTTRTFMGVAQVSADAASGLTQCLCGSNLTQAAGGTSVNLVNSGGTRQVQVRIGSTTYTWTLTASEIAATAAGQTFAYRLEFSETADTATLQINGLPAVAKSSVTAQHGAGQTAVQFGAYASGNSPLPGKLGAPWALLSGSLSSTEWERIANAAGYSSADHDSLVLTEDSIGGDYPARSRYLFTDQGTLTRQAVLIASQSESYDSANTAQLRYEAESLTPLDLAAVTTKTGAEGGASNNAVQHTSISPTWTPILSTQHATYGHLTHRGNYRILARVWATAAARVRFEYSLGDSATRRVNDSVSVAGDGSFYIVDLGEVRVPSMQTGSQRWLGAITGQADTSGVTIGVDKVFFAPLESPLAIVKARQVSGLDSGSTPLTIDARDLFNQTSGNLNGKTADKGGAWSTAGSTTDFTIDTVNGRVSRTTVSDASPRYAVLGSNSSYQFAAADIVSSAFTLNYWQGVLLRYVDSSNWLAAVLSYNGTDNRIDILQTISSSTTILYESFLPPQPAGGLKRISASVDVQGRIEAQFDGVTYSAVSTAAKTGGTLASGKQGIIDYHPSATATTRQWDNYVASTIDPDTACRSGGRLEVRSDSAARETSTTGYYAPAFVQGDYPRRPASGVEARPCRTLILASAGDFETLPDATPAAFKVDSYYRPTYLFVPEPSS